MTPPFVIFALPRSRTAWLSKFLTYGEWHCGHEELRHIRSLDDVKSWLSQPNTGTAETSGATWWRTLRNLSPQTRVVTVRRPVQEVLESMMRLGVAFDRAELERLLIQADHKLDQIEKRVPGVLSVKFSDLKSEATCKAVFEHCLPYPHNHIRWVALDKQNVQADMPALMRYCEAYKPQLAKINAQMKAMTLAEFAARPFRDAPDVMFREEFIDAVLRDAEPAMRAHCSVVGEHPDASTEKNWDLVRRLEQNGEHQIITARCNGKIFGYLMTALAPSLDDPNKTMAAHTMFYASPGFPGMGQKLLRAANEALASKGIEDVILRSGVRGDGPRIGTLARRLGSEKFGEMFLIKLHKG